MPAYKLGKVVIRENVVLNKPEDRVEPERPLRLLEYYAYVPPKVQILHIFYILMLFYVPHDQNIKFIIPPSFKRSLQTKTITLFLS